MLSQPEAIPLTGVATIIVTWNVRQHLVHCLDSLRAACQQDSTELSVWVVDNGSSDGTVEMVRSDYAWVRLIANQDNLGYVAANNQAMEQLVDRTRFLWLLNPDTIVSPGALPAMLAFIDDHSSAGLGGPKLLNPDGTLQECAFRFPGMLQALFSLGLAPPRLYYTALNGRYPREAFDQERPFRIDHPLGAAMLVRSEAVQEVGLLDTGFFMYCEEIDWAWRLHNAGWESWLVPDAQIVHVGGASSRQAMPAATHHLWQSRARLYRKHRDRLTWLLVRSMVRSVFAMRHRRTDDKEWAAAYAGIVESWQ
jgi:N-acetylglucosaminyl-diphospho-decaprenol L-rhamnosyltransferase